MTINARTLCQGQATIGREYREGNIHSWAMERDGKAELEGSPAAGSCQGQLNRWRADGFAQFQEPARATSGTVCPALTTRLSGTRGAPLPLDVQGQAVGQLSTSKAQSTNSYWCNLSPNLVRALNNHLCCLFVPLRSYQRSSTQNITTASKRKESS